MNQNNDRSDQFGAKPSSQGSGSDTASAAKNPTSPVGASPKPQDSFSGSGHGGSDTASAAAMSGARSGASSPQSSTLASHTSRPLGSTQSVGAGSSSHTTNSPSAQSGTQSARDTAQGAADSIRQSAQSAAESTRQTADQVQRQARDAYEQASSWASDQYESASRNLDYASRRSRQELDRARHGAERFIQENPVLVGVMGLAAGLVIGALLPRTRQEDRTFGRWADEVREQGVRYARDMTQRGREYVEEAFSGDDPGSSSYDRERRGDDRGGGPRPGGAGSGGPGRYQNH